MCDFFTHMCVFTRAVCVCLPIYLSVPEAGEEAPLSPFREVRVNLALDLLCEG